MRDVPNGVLVNQNQATFDRVLRQRFLDYYRHRPDPCAEIEEIGISLEKLPSPEGYREWSILQFSDPAKYRRVGLTVAWWTRGDGARLVRIIPYAFCDDSKPDRACGYPLTPWAAIFPQRASALHRTRKERIQRLLSRRLTAEKSEQRLEPFLPMLGHTVLIGSTEDSIFLANNRRHPASAVLIIRDALGIYQKVEVPVRFAQAETKNKKLASPTARIHAALDFTWKTQLAG